MSEKEMTREEIDCPELFNYLEPVSDRFDSLILS